MFQGKMEPVDAARSNVEPEPDEPSKSEKPRHHLRAVGWMGGPDLLSRLGVILREAQRPNGWMHVEEGRVHDERVGGSGALVPIRVAPAAPPSPEDDGTVWFDYIADLGDDTDSMYAVAYGCYVALAAPTGDEPDVGDVLRRHLGDGEARSVLPRGRFLFLGGDTAYHVADAVTITRRVRDPFEWAYDDARRADPSLAAARARLYGIPGNHDWYNHLDGFAKVFRRQHAERIELRGFEPVQSASYVAIQLPHQWLLWGLDIYTGLDADQARYFGTLGPVPSRLVLCTPSPPRAFDSVDLADHHDESLAKLRIPRGYVDQGFGAEGSRAQLDLSGDVHHYARYEGPARGYTSVVSGLGGAFHHPTFTKHGTLHAARRYPTRRRSIAAVGAHLLDPRTMLVGSWFRAFPVILGLVFGFAALGSRASQWSLRGALSWIPFVGRLAIPAGDAGDGVRSLASTLWILLAAACVGLAVWRFQAVTALHTQDPDRRIALPDARVRFNPWKWFDPNRSYWVSTALVVAAVAVVAVLPVLPFAPTSEHAILDVATWLLGVGALAGGFAFAFFAGGKGLSAWGRSGVAALGVVHGFLQVATAVFFSLSIVDLATAGIAVAANVLFAILLVASRALFKRRALWGAAMALLGVLGWWGVMTLLVVLGGGRTLSGEAHWALRSAGLIVGAVLAIVPCCCIFTWYLAVAALFDAHNNEVGGAARVTAFRQMIRFKVDAGGLTGYVISIENRTASRNGKVAAARRPDEDLVFTVVDRFHLAPPPAGAPPAIDRAAPSPAVQ
ncbi:MAG: hypothetical protein U0414_19780 [Polyangiaceae bacterium]